MGRSDLAHEIDVPDVDAELERRGGDERLQRPVLQPVLGVEANLLREAAVMRGDRILAEPLAQMARGALRHLARVHEDQRRPVLADQLRQPVVVLLPHLVRHDGIERGARELDGEVELAAGTFLDNRASRGVTSRPPLPIADQEARDLLYRLLRRGGSDALNGPAEARPYAPPLPDARAGLSRPG